MEVKQYVQLMISLGFFTKMDSRITMLLFLTVGTALEEATHNNKTTINTMKFLAIII